jgi:UDP-N-acetylmuramoylalanine--D-glutamate ligase
MDDWSGHLVVLGLGASGMAAARWGLARAAAGADVRVTVIDSGGGVILEERAAELTAAGAEVFLGSEQAVAGDLVVTSPGIRPTSPLMVSARATGAPMISEIELAYRISSAPWVAITGTNGKTTTTALVAHLLREAGMAAEPAGNFGPPAVDIARELGEAGVIVAEVSSFQLMLVDEFRPRVAVLLNITPDHLDYHGSMAAYAADKARVFARQGPGDTAVIDVDDPGSAAYADPVQARGVPVLRVSRLELQAEGACLRDRMLCLEHAGVTTELVTADELEIKGDHNVSNALAAAVCAHALGADVASIRRGLVSFSAIEHRLEPVGVVAGVEYFNDSKATNPDAVLKALTAFGERPVVLLLGGRNKGVDLRPLMQAVAERVRAVVLFGEAASEFENCLADSPVERRTAGDLATAVSAAAGMARPGDVVLLSPGCTSFDEFADYGERGRAFKALVEAMESGGGR